jgi:hypothetical protein
LFGAGAFCDIPALFFANSKSGANVEKNQQEVHANSGIMLKFDLSGDYVL